VQVGKPDLDLGDKVQRKLPVQYPSTTSPLQHCVSPESVTKAFDPDGHILTENPSLTSGSKEFFRKYPINTADIPTHNSHIKNATP
jgi:hypothetical protein